MESIEIKIQTCPPTGIGAKLKAFLICFLLFGFSFQHSYSQTFAEWFQQGKTQIKYLTLQIAALNAFENSIRQGYNIAKNEWGSIGRFKDGELGLHQNYYNSLSQVNPLIKNSTDLKSIQTEQQTIISQFYALNNLTGLSVQERAYIQSVRQNLVAECNKDSVELEMVSTPGKLVMSDDERIRRINKTAASIKDKYVFACTFCTRVRILAAQRNQECDSNAALQKLYGINP